MNKKNLFQPIRSDGPESHLKNKKRTPTMGGIFIVLATLITTFLFIDIFNRYILVICSIMICFASIGLIDDLKNDTVLVMNSDILTNIDYEDFYNYYLEKSSNMCIDSIPYQISIPYAVLELDNDKITAFSEKPTYTYYSNGGIYLLNKQLLKRVPKNIFYNATDLMDDLIKSNFTVNHYPLLNYWLDIGKHQDFAKAQEDIKHISF
jgi:ADP-glucose pyrophosphorylase